MHDYLRVDDRRLHASLPGEVTDLRSFCTGVFEWVASG